MRPSLALIELVKLHQRAHYQLALLVSELTMVAQGCFRGQGAMRGKQRVRVPTQNEMRKRMNAARGQFVELSRNILVIAHDHLQQRTRWRIVYWMMNSKDAEVMACRARCLVNDTLKFIELASWHFAECQ